MGLTRGYTPNYYFCICALSFLPTFMAIYAQSGGHKRSNRHTFSSPTSHSRSSSPLFCFTYTNTLPFDMYGIMIRGISSSKHIPMSDITLGCLNESMVVTSFSSLSLSFASDKARGKFLFKCWNDISIIILVTSACLYSYHISATSTVKVTTIHQSGLSCTMEHAKC